MFGNGKLKDLWDNVTVFVFKVLINGFYALFYVFFG